MYEVPGGKRIFLFGNNEDKTINRDRDREYRIDVQWLYLLHRLQV